MDAERWKRVMALFEEAVDLPEGERLYFVARESGADSEVRDEVFRLLRHHNPNAKTPGHESDEIAMETLRGGRAGLEEYFRHQGYSDLKPLAEGGSSIVFEAIRTGGSRVAI